MPTYYLNVNGFESFRETEGFEAPDLAAALKDAHEGARELWAEGIRLGEDRRHWSMDITDEGGTVLGNVRFEDTVEERPAHRREHGLDLRRRRPPDGPANDQS